MADPSHIAKLARAKEHLIDLQEAVDAFAGTHPYTVTKRVEGKKQRRVWRLEFTSSPADTKFPVIAADAINNLRFSLDHLMCALVPPSERRKVMFPIFFQGVWEAIVPGEDQQRIKSRMRWASVVKTLPAEAVTFLKQCQPADLAPDDPGSDLLTLINRWSNRDRHERLPILVTGVRDLVAQVIRDDSGTETAEIKSAAYGLPDGADLKMVPQYAVDMQVKGTAVVGIGVNDGRAYYRIPKHLTKAADLIDKRIIPPLTPFIREDAT